MGENLSLFETSEQVKTHEFGGIWTRDKLDALQQYLSSFTKALSNKSWFRKIYIDAFAGTGSCDINIGNHRFTVAGSAKLALDTDPRFDQVVFIENDAKRHAHLIDLKNKYNESKIDVYKGDANILLPEILRKHLGKNHRGVIFIDPYGMSVEWKVLEAIANTKRLDVWYLFSLSGLYRQAARTEWKLDPGKEAAIDRQLGPCDWRAVFYSTPPNDDLFGDPQAKVREPNLDNLIDFVTNRLKGIFPYVSAPLILPKKGIRRYALYFAVSNESKRAQDLAKRISTYILKSLG